MCVCVFIVILIHNTIIINTNKYLCKKKYKTTLGIPLEQVKIKYINSMIYFPVLYL